MLHFMVSWSPFLKEFNSLAGPDCLIVLWQVSFVSIVVWRKFDIVSFLTNLKDIACMHFFRIVIITYNPTFFLFQNFEELF